jgi:serine/threonine protein phosphatase PrpC
VANAGDSRAVLARKNSDKIQGVEMSVDHKPELPEEK